MKDKKNKQLLVEGNDDKHVISILCEEYTLPETFEITDCKGIDNLKVSLSVRLKQSSDFDTIGMVIDADTDLTRRWQSICSVLTGYGYSVPDTIPSEGLILRGYPKTVGVWIMPDNHSPGMLEDFIRLLVPSGDDLVLIAESTLDSIETRKLNRYSLPYYRSKALIHTWLAWQKIPGTPLGLSIKKKYLNSDTKQCSLFIDWLKALFG